MTTRILTSLFLLLLTTGLHAQTLLKDIETFVPGASSSPSNWAVITEDLFIFEALNSPQSQYLFASDGTESGTIGLGTYQVDTDIISFGEKTFFGGCNLLLGADSCTSLYVSDGTVAGTGFFFDLDPNGLSLGIEDIVAGDSLFFFSGHTNAAGYELFVSDGTKAGTRMVMDIAPGLTSGYVGELAVIDNVAYFAGYTDANGKEAWRSDGTAEGTYMIADLNDGTANGDPYDFVQSGGYVYFSALGTNTGVELRRTNGSEGNVELIGELGTTDSSWPREKVDSDGILYYAAEGNDAAGYELVVYDHVGQPLHIDFNGVDIFPRALMAFGDGEVIFNAETENGRELWRSDGTLAGTYMIIDLYPGEKDGVHGIGAPGESFYVWNDSLVYFAGADSVNAKGEFVYELFVTDGTAAGTSLVSDQVPGTEGSNPGNFFEFGDRLYFAATDANIGREPFYLDFGTTTSINEPYSDLSISLSAYPNPLPKGSSLNVAIDLATATEVHAQLYDLQGNSVKGILSLGHLPTGQHDLQVQLGDHPSGLYYLVLNTSTGSQVNMPILME